MPFASNCIWRISFINLYFVHFPTFKPNYRHTFAIVIISLNVFVVERYTAKEENVLSVVVSFPVFACGKCINSITEYYLANAFKMIRFSTSFLQLHAGFCYLELHSSELLLFFSFSRNDKWNVHFSSVQWFFTIKLKRSNHWKQLSILQTNIFHLNFEFYVNFIIILFLPLFFPFVCHRYRMQRSSQMPIRQSECECQWIS